MKKFDDIINSEQPVLVDFSAEWCEPSRNMNSVLKKVASEVGGAAKILKVDVDKNWAAVSKYNVIMVPTILIFKKGEVQWKSIGAIEACKLINAITLLS